MYNNKDKYYCKKHFHHEQQYNHCYNEKHLRRKCCKCRGYCKMIYFKKYNGCCKFVYKCQCGYCFEVIYDYENNCYYERECSCLDEKKIINEKFYFVEKSCQHKKDCYSNYSHKNKCCKCG